MSRTSFAYAYLYASYDNNQDIHNPCDVLAPIVYEVFLEKSGTAQSAEDLSKSILENYGIRVPITVVEYKDVIYTLNNKRLWAFKESRVDDIPVIVKEADASFISKLNKKLYDDIHIRVCL